MKKRYRKKKRKNLLIIPILIIVIVGIFLFIEMYKKQNKLKVTLISDLNTEINTKVTLHSFIKNIENGTILTKDDKVDTSILGEQELELLIKNSFDEEIKYNFKINIVDTTKPTIENQNEIITYQGKNLDLLKDVIVTDNSKEEISAKITGTYDINTLGEYPLQYIATDSSGNETTSNFTLKVIKDPNNYTFTTSKGYSAKVINGVTYINGILIANKTYPLPSTYGNGLTNDTKNAFNQMKADAAVVGLNIYISSGYRSYYDQRYIYNNYVANDGKVNADTYSARAGHSEHQSGLAIDLNSISDSFAYTEEGKWINNNCHKYGFILRYPKDKSNITGYKYEPWHLRYVGTELATKLYNNGDWITIEEHFGITSKYNY